MDIEKRIRTVHICMCTGIFLNIMVAFLNHTHLYYIGNIFVVLLMIPTYIICIKKLHKERNEQKHNG